MSSTDRRPSESLPRWYDAPSPRDFPKYQRGSVVETFRLHVDEAHEAVLAAEEQRCSTATGSAMTWIRNHFSVQTIRDPSGSTERDRLYAADVVLDTDAVAALPPWARALVGERADAPDCPLPSNTAIRIAWGRMTERQREGETVRQWEVNHRSPKFELQQLFLVLLPDTVFTGVSRPLRPGVTQEVAQQLTSHLMLMDGGDVAIASFPSIEERDPHQRRREWEAALDRVCRRATPFPYVRARDRDPRAYAPDDPRGDRLVNTDPDWATVVARLDTRRTPLLYVTGTSIRLYRRVWSPGHRGRTARGTYAAIPIDRMALEQLPPETRARVVWWRKPAVLSTLSPLTPGTPRLTEKTSVLLIPLSFGRKRTERRVIPALTRLPIQWARAVHRTLRRGRDRDKWFLQLTVGYGIPRNVPTRILGVHFGIDNIYYWSLLEDCGPDVEPVLLEEGQVQGNSILRHGLHRKDTLEWNQQRGRWVGGRVYGRALRSDTHRVVDGIIALARMRNAGLGVERIRWVPKGQGSPADNRRFSAWNYGQLPTMLAYKAPPAGVRFITEVFPTKTDRAQDEAEQARRIARKTLQRLREQERRAAEAARQRAEREASVEHDA